MRMKPNPKSQKLSFVPRSLLQTVGKIKQALEPNAEHKVVEEFRASRQRTISSGASQFLKWLKPTVIH